MPGNNQQPQPSKAFKTILLFAGGISLANLLVRYFGFSIIGPMGLYPDDLKVQGQDFQTTLAWVEFAFVALALFVVCAALLAFIVLRECYWFLRGGNAARVVTAKSVFFMTMLVAVMYYILFDILPSGRDSLEGTRGAGLGLTFFMSLLGVIQTLTLMVLLSMSLNPKMIQAGVDEAEISR